MKALKNTVVPSWSDVTVSSTGNREPSRRTAVNSIRRPSIGPVPVSRNLARPRWCASRYSGATIRSATARPTAADAGQPNIASARRFQNVTRPLASMLTTASSAPSRISFMCAWLPLKAARAWRRCASERFSECTVQPTNARNTTAFATSTSSQPTPKPNSPRRWPSQPNQPINTGTIRLASSRRRATNPAGLAGESSGSFMECRPPIASLPRG